MMSKNILVCCIRFPKINGRGDQLLSYKRIEFLSKKYKIFLICFNTKDCDSFAINCLEIMGVKIILVKWSWFHSIYNIFLCLFSKNIPFQIAMFKSKYYSKTFNDVCLNINPDVIISYTLRPILNIDIYSNNIVIEFIDSIALNFYRRSIRAAWYTKFIYFSESLKLLKLERFYSSLTYKSFVVSSIDKKYINNDDKIIDLPLGVELFNNVNSKKTGSDVFNIIFTGNMFYGPNIEAVTWFTDNCWQILKTMHPNCKLIIAGNNPAPAILKLDSDPNITITGKVSSLSNLICSSHVAIAPMVSGSGMQLKILEAMACSIPVITTTLGLGGLQAIVNNDLYVADEPQLFVKYISVLLNSEELRNEVGANGYEYVKKNHSWNIVNKSFEECIENLIT